MSAKPPTGLTLNKVDDMPLITAALAEINHLYKTDQALISQISANKHFFCSCPYPLNFLSGPVFPRDHAMLKHTWALIQKALSVILSKGAGGKKETEFAAEMVKNWLANPRMNVIVRQYDQYQKIRSLPPPARDRSHFLTVPLWRVD